MGRRKRIHGVADVYTDASVRDFSAGYGVYFEDDPEYSFHQHAEIENRGENNLAELDAIDSALIQIRSNKKAYDTYRIWTDNTSALNAISGLSVNGLFSELVESIEVHISCLKKRNIDVCSKYVPSRAARGNLIADKLARSARVGLPRGVRSVSTYVSQLESIYRWR